MFMIPAKHARERSELLRAINDASHTRVKLASGGSLHYDPDSYGGRYALHAELAEGFDDIGNYWRSITQK